MRKLELATSMAAKEEAAFHKPERQNTEDLSDLPLKIPVGRRKREILINAHHQPAA